MFLVFLGSRSLGHAHLVFRKIFFLLMNYDNYLLLLLLYLLFFLRIFQYFVHTL